MCMRSAVKKSRLRAPEYRPPSRKKLGEILDPAFAFKHKVKYKFPDFRSEGQEASG